MGKFIDMTGMTFGTWTVIAYAGKSKWLCQCACGNTATVVGATLRNGTSTRCRSCATAVLNKRTKVGNKNNITHGQCGTRLYRIWSGMIARCEIESSSGFKWYGAKGVKVCEEWHRFETFRDWAIANGYRENLSIDRIDVYGNYYPDNCRWATTAEQSLNKRSSKANKQKGGDAK